MINIEKKISNETASILLTKKCIEFNFRKKFQLTSGRKSIVYCDCRKIIAYTSEREKLINFALKKIKLDKTLNSLTNIAGGESAGIPYASLLAQKMKLPLSYIRKERKKFGKKSQIEGVIKPKDNVLIVEDLITDGKSKYNFIDAVEKVGGRIKAIFVIFNYGINNEFLEYKGKKIKIISLAKWEDVLNIIISKKFFQKKQIKLIVNFLNSMGIKNLKSFL
ncbi:MAG: orotate phosphoribosyltransferase [Rickettsiales bacterium]|nr:orotate phosphoribosyltransferase [Rickettsiales bacterium]|tara:strand:- start:819 stop:1481 length:663 start_codon:yes stop_codon:yes gene_type:complete